MSSSLELSDVYRSVVEHAAATTGGTQAVLTRLDTRAGRAAHGRHAGPFRRRPAAQRRGLRQVARTREPLLQRDGSFMHAPIELGPRLYGVLSVATARSLRRGPARAAHAAGALLRRGDRQRHRLPARAPHRALAHARVRAGVAAAGARLRDRPAVRAGARRADRRRPVRGLAASQRGGRRARGGRRGQGRRDRRAERDGALLHRGAQLGRRVAGTRARADQRDAGRPAAERHLRDGVPGGAGAGVAALGERRASAAACTCRRARRASSRRPACRWA